MTTEDKLKILKDKLDKLDKARGKDDYHKRDILWHSLYEEYRMLQSKFWAENLKLERLRLNQKGLK